METLLNTAIAVTLTAVLLIVVRTLFRHKISPRWQSLLWLVLVVRMLFPMLPSSPLSVMNFLPPAQIPKATISIERVPSPSSPAVQEQERKAGSMLVQSQMKVVRWDRIVVIVWAAGAGSFFIYFAGVYLAFAYRVRRAEICTDREILLVLRRCGRNVGITREVPVRYWEGSPMLKGLLSPTIFIPKNTRPEDLEMIFLHELTHLARRDVLCNLAALVLLGLNWFNPVVWYCSRLYRQDAESCCDEQVLAITGSRREYAELLIRTARRKGTLPATTALSCGTRELLQRVSNIVERRQSTFAGGAAFLLAGLLLCTCCLSNPLESQRRIQYRVEQKVQDARVALAEHEQQKALAAYATGLELEQVEMLSSSVSRYLDSLRMDVLGVLHFTVPPDLPTGFELQICAVAQVVREDEMAPDEIRPYNLGLQEPQPGVSCDVRPPAGKFLGATVEYQFVNTEDGLAYFKGKSTFHLNDRGIPEQLVTVRSSDRERMLSDGEVVSSSAGGDELLECLERTKPSAYAHWDSPFVYRMSEGGSTVPYANLSI